MASPCILGKMIQRLLPVLLLASFAAADKGAVKTRPGIAAVDVAIGGFIEKKAIAGAVVLIDHKGKIIHDRAYGHQDREAGSAMRKDSVFRIYSMTKPVASVAALMLVDEGKLGLDDSVAKYLPELKSMKLPNGDAPKRAMTVRDLLRHTAGLTYGWGMSKVERQYRNAKLLSSEHTLADMVTKLGTLPLAHAPGTRWKYSVAVDVLGRVVEVASGQPFDQFLKARLFDPLGMHDTGFHVIEKNRARFTANYRARAGGIRRPVDVPATSRYARPALFFSGGGGLVSTAADYLAFCRMMRAGGVSGKRVFLKPATYAAMTRNQLAPELTPIGFGLVKMPGVGFGLGVSVIVEGRDKGEYGWGGAATTGFHIAPKDELIVITMAQVMPRNSAIHEKIRGLAYERVRK